MMGFFKLMINMKLRNKNFFLKMPIFSLFLPNFWRNLEKLPFYPDACMTISAKLIRKANAMGSVDFHIMMDFCLKDCREIKIEKI